MVSRYFFCHSLISFFLVISFLCDPPPPPSKSATIPSFYTVHVCSFSFKGLSQSQRLGGQKWVSWNMTYSYLMCYAKYLWILSLIFNSQLNLHRESHLRLRNPNLVQWYYGCSYSEISLILLAPITFCICAHPIVRCTFLHIICKHHCCSFLAVKIFVKSPFQPLQTKMMNSAELLLPFTCFLL